MSDKVRQMTNKVVLAGKVAELEVRKGTTEKKVIFIRSTWMQKII